jgi:hypothetical protein
MEARENGKRGGTTVEARLNLNALQAPACAVPTEETTPLVVKVEKENPGEYRVAGHGQRFWLHHADPAS